MLEIGDTFHQRLFTGDDGEEHGGTATVGGYVYYQEDLYYVCVLEDGYQFDSYAGADDD